MASTADTDDFLPEEEPNYMDTNSSLNLGDTDQQDALNVAANKSANARKKSNQAKRIREGNYRATVSVPMVMKKMVEDLQDAYKGKPKYPKSSIVFAGVVLLNNAIKAGKIDLDDFETLAMSLKSTHDLDIPDDFGSDLW